MIRNPIICVLLFFILPLHLIAQSPRLMMPIGHTKGIGVASFSTDDKLILTASDDMSVKLWQVNTGKLLAEFRPRGNSSWFRDAGFVPGDKFIYTSTDSVRLWKLPSSDFHGSFTGKLPERSVYSFTPDGSKMISYDYDSVFIWNLERGTKTRAVFCKGPRTASFSPDGERFIIGDEKGKLIIYQTNNYNAVDSFQVSGGGGIFDAVYSPNGKQILVTNRHVTLWNANGDLMDSLAKFENSYAIAGFSPDSRYIIAMENGSYGDKYARIWQTIDGKLVSKIASGLNYFKLSGRNFSPDGNMLIIPSADDSEKMVVYQLPQMKALNTLSHHTSSVRVSGWNHQGSLFVTAASDKTVKIYESKEKNMVNELAARTIGNLDKVRFSPDGKYFTLESSEVHSSIWNSSDGTLATPFLERDERVPVLEFSPDGKKILTIPKTGEVRLWDAKTGSLLFPDLKKDLNYAYVNYQGEFAFTEDSRSVFIANHDPKAFLFDTETGKLRSGFNQDFFIDRAAINKQGTYAATISNDTLRIWIASTGQLNAQVIEQGIGADSLVFTESGEQLLLFSGKTMKCYNLKGKLAYKPVDFKYYFGLVRNASQLLLVDDGKIRLIDTKNGKIVFEHSDSELDPFGYGGLPSFECMIDGPYLLYKCNYGVKILDMDSRKIITDIKWYGSNGVSYSACFDSMRSKLMIGFTDGMIRMWRVADGSLLHEIKAHEGVVNNIYFLQGQKKLLSIGDDNKAKVWDIVSGKELYQFFMLDHDNYFIQAPNGYYMCTSNAAKSLHYVSPELNIITFEQLDVKYNRPDRVLEAMGNSDTLLIRSYRKAYEKRLRKLGIDTTQFRENYSVPLADFVNRNTVSYDQKDGRLALQIKASDNGFDLDRFNIWVNESPLFGQRGINIRNRNLRSFDTSVTITLTEGINNIETSVTNVNGTESYRMPLAVKFTGDRDQKVITKFIGIGIDRFAESQYDLRYSSKDIRDLAVKFREKYGNDIEIDTLFNEQVTVSNVKALRKRLLQLSEHDRVIVAYSGHGVLSNEFDYYLSTYAMNFDKPAGAGLPYDELERLLDSIPPRQKLLLIDACHSGEVDKEDLVRLNETNDSLIKGLKPVAHKKEGQLGLKNSFELMQNLFVNVGKSTGATIISAAAGTQFALERGDLKNGVFTYSILEAFEKNETLTINQLKKIVTARVTQLTNGLQKPTSRNETISFDWRVW